MPVIQRRDLGRTCSLGDGDHARVYGAEWQVGVSILLDEFRGSFVIGGPKIQHLQDALGK